MGNGYRVNLTDGFCGTPSWLIATAPRPSGPSPTPRSG
jgi:hypothetical protein